MKKKKGIDDFFSLIAYSTGIIFLLISWFVFLNEKRDYGSYIAVSLSLIIFWVSSVGKMLNDKLNILINEVDEK